MAGIDLAHVGAQFDAPAVAEEALAEVARQDRETLRLAVEERCPRAVHQDIAQGGDPRNICGHGPLVSLLVALDGEPLAGETLLYDRWHDGQSAVSFAAAVYRRAGGTR